MRRRQPGQHGISFNQSGSRKNRLVAVNQPPFPLSNRRLMLLMPCAAQRNEDTRIGEKPAHAD
jgi:hypothetical protein